MEPIQARVYAKDQHRILSFERAGKQQVLVAGNIATKPASLKNGSGVITLDMSRMKEVYLVVAGIDAGEAEGLLL